MNLIERKDEEAIKLKHNLRFIKFVYNRYHKTTQKILITAIINNRILIYARDNKDVCSSLSI